MKTWNPGLRHINFITFLFLCLTVVIQAAEPELIQKAQIRFPYTIAWGDTVGGTDVWGYTAPDSTEYALMGVYEGVAVVRTSDMEIIEVVPGPQWNDPYYHRDIVTYSHYAYVTNENSGVNEGTMILDLQYLPDSVRFVQSYATDTDVQSHNLAIDTSMGFAYILKENYGNGIRIVDLSDPENPVDVGTVHDDRVHDCYARNDTLWVAEGSNGAFSVYDMEEKLHPQLILRVEPEDAGYAHNIWPTDDGKHFITTEETDYKTVKIWDMTTPDSTYIIGEYLGDSQLAHNAHVNGAYVYLSHYESGVTVMDISDPADPVEVAQYDTYPASESPSFYGCWGVYPYMPSGDIYASDIEGYLRVLTLDPDSTQTSMEPTIAPTPGSFRLAQNYPNPFNMETQISYTIDVPSDVHLTIFNTRGETIRRFNASHTSTGEYSFHWNGLDAAGSPVASGMYFYRLTSENNSATRKMLLVK